MYPLTMPLVSILATLFPVLVASLPLPTPTAQQLHYMDNELTMFMHFSVCTFNDGCDGGQQNCGYQGKDQPYPASSFNPSDVDTEQWAHTALSLGARQVCLTTHHSGGFALWPTRASNYSILASPFGATGRDIVREFVDTMRAHDIEPCFYIVLNMDCAEAHNTVQGYYDIQASMLTELLTNYGPIPRMWWDMVSSTFALPWNPGGFPGLFKNLSAHAKALAPNTLLLPGTDGCLVGGETGSGSYPVFNFNQGPTGYACQRMDTPPNATQGLIFAPHEQDHSILNPGDMWWWVKGHVWLSAGELFETYLKTIGRGNTYILNMPPNTTGVIPEYLTNETDQLGAAIRASFSPASAQSRLVNATVACGSGAPALELPPPPSGPFAFDAVVLEEDLALGNQRIASYELQACFRSSSGECVEDAAWTAITGPGKQTVTLGVSVGRRVIERGFNASNGLTISAAGLRFRCSAAFPADGPQVAYLKSFSVHKMVAPGGWPPAPICQQFGCTCKGMADFYGVGANGGKGLWGCAPAAAQEWWVNEAQPCQQPGYSCCLAADYTKKSPPFPGC